MVRRLAMLLVLAACRDHAPAPAVVDAGPDVDPGAAPPTSVEPRHAEARPEAGALVNPLCEGMSLSLFETSCEVADAEWTATPPPEPGALAQEAKITGLAGASAPRTIEFALVNRSAKAVLVPLRFDDRSPGKSFSAIAETIGAPGIYALAPPRVSAVASDGGAHLHSTRIKLPPGGRATALLTLDFTPAERLDRRGLGDAGAGVGAGAATARPSTLEGSFTVHIGQLLSHAEMGDPARVQISNGIRK